MSAAARIASRGAALVAIAALVSGPIAIAIVAAVHPQPAWQGAARFAAELHPIQMLPYLAGFGLVAGFVLLVAGLHVGAPDPLRARTSAALIFVAIYASLVTLNYVLQTTFVPALAARPGDGDLSLAGALTMSNPRSLGWSLEMWGYAMSGVATWLVAPVVGGRAATALVANGVVSIAGAAWTVVQPGWVMAPAGLAMFAAWNILIVVAAVLVWTALRGQVTMARDDARARGADRRALVGMR